jgi:hypothetical protein
MIKKGFHHGGNKPYSPFWKTEQPGLQVGGERHGVLQDAGQPLCGAGALAAPDPAAAGLGPASDHRQAVRASTLAAGKDITEPWIGCRAARTSISDLSAHVEEAVEQGWVYGSLMFGEYQVRTGYLVVGILKTPGLRNALSASPRSSTRSVETLMERCQRSSAARRRTP